MYSAGAEDAHHNATDTWADPVDVGIYAFDPGDSAEVQLPGHERVITTPKLYFPDTETFASRDRVTVRGLLFEVDGETRVWRHPNGRDTGNVVDLRRVTG